MLQYRKKKSSLNIKGIFKAIKKLLSNTKETSVKLGKKIRSLPQKIREQIIFFKEVVRISKSLKNNERLTHTEAYKNKLEQYEDKSKKNKQHMEELIDMLEVLKELNSQQTEVLVGLGGSTDTIVSQVLEVSQNSAHESSTIKQSHDAVNFIVDKVYQINGLSENIGGQMRNSTLHVNHGNQSIINISEQMENISEKVLFLQKVVQEFTHRMQKINDMNQSINDIAVQTKLLALNATIEAARVGEHGRGFSVVAEEISKLSAQSSLTSKDISQLISELKKDVSSILNEITLGVNEVKKGMQVTLTAQEVFKDIQQSVTDVTNHINKVTDATQEITQSVQSLAVAMGDITDKAKENAQNASSVSQLAQGQTGVVLEIATLGQQVEEILNEVKNKVSKV